MNTTLDNSKQSIQIIQPSKLLGAAFCPTNRHLHGSRHGRLFCRIRRAFIEYHGYIRIQSRLDLHRALGVEKYFISINRGLEFNAGFRDFSQITQAEHLKAARVGQNRLIPAHKTMQPPMLLDHIHAGSQHQVKRIPQQNLHPNLVQGRRHHALD